MGVILRTPSAMAMPDIEDQIQVHSSNIAMISYDPYTSTLFVWFLNSSVYRYEQVPRSIYAQLKSAPSKGKFFWARIRNVYNFSRIK